MAKVKREVSIEYDGETYTFEPSNRLMRRIEADMYPMTLGGLVSCMKAEQVPLPTLAFVFSEFIKAGGGSVDEDSVYADLIQSEGRDIVGLIHAIDEVLTPPDYAAKNLPAPNKQGAKRKKGKA